MMQPAKMLLVFVDETDMAGELPLYEFIIRRLFQLGVRGATVQIGAMGFGSHHRVHRKRLLGISDDRPVIISAVDAEEKLRSVLPELRPLVQEGLIILMDVEVIG